MTGEAPEAVIVQRVPAPPERVWDLWTSAAGLRTWWWNHWDDVRIEVDAVVGGRYRIVAPTGGIRVSGEYLLVEPPRRLWCTWIWGDGDGDGPVEQVEATFTPDGDGTLVTVRHTGPWLSDEPAEAYRVGWAQVLGALAATV